MHEQRIWTTFFGLKTEKVPNTVCTFSDFERTLGGLVLIEKIVGEKDKLNKILW